MIERDIEVPAADGTADAVLFQPESEGRWPGVIHLTDIVGIRPEHRAMARRLSERGYAVLMPNVFYRSGRPPIFDFPPQMGEERTMKRFGELASGLTPEASERDAAAYVDFFAAQGSVRPGKLAVVGYCFTGAMAMRAAAVRPDKVALAASFHGGWLYTDQPTSPHRVLPKVKAQLYFGHAIEDRTMPAEAIEKLEAALAAWGGEFESETYDGAYHGWTTPGAPAYHQPSADRAFEKLSQVLAAALR